MGTSGPRRRSSEIRDLLISGAARVFAEKGYADATLDEIARDAGVARSALYRHFPGKSELFVEAVLQPFLTLLEDYRSLWQSQVDRPWDDARFMRSLVGLIYDSCMDNRDTLMGLAAAAHSLDEPTREQLVSAIVQALEELLRIVQPESDRRGWVPPESLGLSLRLMIGSIASVTLFGDVFLAQDYWSGPTRDEIVDHIARLFLHGAALAPASGLENQRSTRREPRLGPA